MAEDLKEKYKGLNTIDVTPTWMQVLPIYKGLIEDAVQVGRSDVNTWAAIEKCFRAMDEINALRKEPGSESIIFTKDEFKVLAIKLHEPTTLSPFWASDDDGYYTQVLEKLRDAIPKPDMGPEI